MVLTLEAALILDLGGHVSPVFNEVVGVDWGRGGEGGTHAGGCSGPGSWWPR